MRNRSPAFAVAAAVALAAVAFALFRLRGTSVETSVYSMLGENAVPVQDEALGASARTVFVVFSSPSATVSRAASAELARRLPHGFADDGGDAPSRLARFSSLADGLVAEKDYAALSTPEGRSRIARSAIRRYIASPVPPAFPPEEDPFCLKERFLISFADSADAVLPVALLPEVASDTTRLESFKSALDGVVAEVGREYGPSLRIMPCGVPLHTAMSAVRCRREIGWLSLFSSVFVFAVALWAFRPLWRVVYLVSSLVFSASAGAIALFLYARSFHLMTVVFGTTVLGLAADYSFHWLLHAFDDRRRTARNLAVSFATTAIALSTLFFSSLPVLRESAVFLTAALAAAAVFAATTHPGCAAPQAAVPAAPSAPARMLRFAFAGVLVLGLAVSICVVPAARVQTSPKALYVPPPELLEPERLLAEKWAPPPEAVAEDVRRLYAEHGAEVANALGLSARLSPPKPPKGRAEALSDALRTLADETARRLLFALAAMLVVLTAIYRGAAAAVAAPSAAALLVASATVTLSGEPINLFHLLAGFLLAGMCVDYTIFLRSAGRGSVKSSVCSLLTSLAGFGALAFVSFRPVAAFGTVLGAGLPVGFVAAFAMSGRRWMAEGGAKTTTEKAASPVGMELLWFCYLAFGLGFLRVMARVVASCAWFFSPAVRKASPSRRKVAMFAQMLADKVAICSGRGRMPAVRDDGSLDAQEFAVDVTAGCGVFILSSHCGSPEVLLALADRPPVFHAWTDLGRTTAFNEFYFRHMRKDCIKFHSIVGIGMETAFDALQWLEKGECLVMAGDRGRGAFRFAAVLRHPVYFATCVAEGKGYVAVIRSLRGSAAEMESKFRSVLAELEGRYPDQVYEWGDGA